MAIVQADLDALFSINPLANEQIKVFQLLRACQEKDEIIKVLEAQVNIQKKTKKPRVKGN